MVVHSIGNGSCTKFWLDPWIHPGLVLVEQLGNRTIYDLGLGRNILVSRYISNGQWAFPPPTSGHHMEFWNLINSIRIPCCNIDDQIVWTADSSGSFSISSAYSIVYTPWKLPSTLDWSNLVQRQHKQVFNILLVWLQQWAENQIVPPWIRHSLWYNLSSLPKWCWG